MSLEGLASMSKPNKIKTTCGVAVPDFYVDSHNLGHCRKYKPFYNKLQETSYMLCEDTMLPCPIDGLHQFPIDEVKAPEWMRDITIAGGDPDRINRKMLVTDREKDIVTCLLDGKCDKEIALKYDVSQQTIKNHMMNLKDKLNANSRIHAIAIVLKLGEVKLV